MAIYGNLLKPVIQEQENSNKSVDIILSEFNNIINEYFNYNEIFFDIVTESELISINESKFTDIVKTIFKKIKEAILFAIKKIKELGANLTQKIKKSNLKNKIENFKNDDKKRENVKTAESEEKAEELKSARSQDDKSNDNSSISTSLVVPSKNIFIMDKKFENYIDFRKDLFHYFTIVENKNVINSYLNQKFKLLFGSKGTTAGTSSNAYNYLKDFDYANSDDTEIEPDSPTEMRKISRKGEEAYFAKFDEAINNMFPGILHIHWNVFKNKETDLETYKKEVLNILDSVPRKQILSKDIYNDKEKYLYSESKLGVLELNKYINSHISYLSDIIKEVEATQSTIEKMIQNNIDYKVTGSSSKKEYTVDIVLYNKYLQKLSKFCYNIISGGQALLQSYTNCLNAEMRQMVEIVKFYNSCYI